MITIRKKAKQMNKLFSMILLCVFLVSCTAAPTVVPTAAPTATTVSTETSVPTSTEIPTASAPTATLKPSATATPAATPTPVYPVTGYGPTNFPENIDPLTGLPVANPAIMNRRPLVVKVENLPRDHRPQWGVSSADIVYEYYTEQGGTRFATVFYGSDSEKVGPIRSARFFDFNVVRMYKANLAFGYAYADLYSALINSEFGNRLILEGERWKGLFTRFEPNGANILQINTGLVNEALTRNKVDNSHQNLDGMLFKPQAPSGGQNGTQLFVRFSGGIYNRWDYDAATGKYTRFADAADDVNRNNEKYAMLTDRNNGNPIAFDNVVILQVSHRYIQRPPAEVVDMTLVGEGNAWIARNGQVFVVKWKRAKTSDVLTLVNPDGTPFPFKPGQTWFEVNGLSSTVSSKDGVWKFVHSMP
jgi:hypothetical protein